MALWLDGVERQTWDTHGGSFTGGPPKGVLHTTETMTWPAYNYGTTVPHLTARPDTGERRLHWRQHVSLDIAARAMRNEAGGVQTNRDFAIQIELIGTCNPEWRSRLGYYYWPEAEEWALAELAAMMRRLEAACAIGRIGVPFAAYPGSYGKPASQRMSLSQWDGFSGWCGHQHVPENTHGDPGNINIARLLGESLVVPVNNFRPVKPIKAPVAPPFPLPAGHYFGYRDGGRESHSGYASSKDRNALRAWQARMRERGWKLDVDGLYGYETHRITRLFQAEKRLLIDGKIGPRTWAAAWAAKVT